MKISNIQMSQYCMALNNIADKVSGKFAYAVARNLRKMVEEGTEYDKMRREIVEKYGEKNETGDYQITVDSPNYQKALEEITEIGDIVNDVDILMVSEDDVCKTQLTATDILSIDFMIKEEPVQ